MFGRCKCESLTKVQQDGYQYCTQCGRAYLAPTVELGEELTHELVDVPTGTSQISRLSLIGERVTQSIQQQRCRNCGKRFTYNTTTGNYELPTPDRVDCIRAGQKPVG